jgi:hypothetical protein
VGTSPASDGGVWFLSKRLILSKQFADQSRMDFDGSPLNMTTLLVVALAVVSLLMIFRKRYESNLPLLFYFVAVLFSNITDREVNPYLLYTGLIFALLLRFEFMNPGFAKLIAFLATGSMGLIIWCFLAEVFGDGSPPF